MASSVATKFLTDRVALVTASTKGIGFAIAKQLGAAGASVVVCSRKEKNVDEAVAALRLENIDAHGTTAHVGNKEDRTKLINFTLDRFTKLDILVSNAAVNPHYGDLMSVTDSQWDKMLDLNVKSAFELTKEAVPHLEASGRGNVVFVSSVAGYSPMNEIGAYSVMKTTLTGLSKSLALNLARRNIRVNTIAPETYSTVTNVTSTSSYLVINPTFGLSTINPRAHQYIRKEDPQNNQIHHSEERAFISLQKDLPSANPEALTAHRPKDPPRRLLLLSSPP
ncbi:unnamed protein product [Caenorhabditis nigoni]